MKKLIRWLKSVNENAKRRARIVIDAGGILGEMDPKWRKEAGRTNDEVAVLLMQIGLVHIQAARLGQIEAEGMITRSQARVNQAAAHLN